MSRQQLEQYRCDLSRRLEEVRVPACMECTNLHCREEEHSAARDSLVLDVMSAVIESSHATIPLVGGREGAGRKDRGSMPGWWEEVAPYRETSVFWHSVWRSAGRPVAGELYNTMKMTRN